MSDQKQNRFPLRGNGGYEEQLSRINGQDGQAGCDTATKERRRAAPVAKAGRDVGSWDAYRNWLTKVQAPEKRRSLPDPALFSWRGYRSWAEKVRRDWDDEEQT